nr:hypothetical protein [Tanacetum cinerariifolium]
MNLLLLEGPLADAPGMGDLQPDIEQLKFLIHRANVAAERSALLDVWTPLSEPLSIQMLIGEASTSAGVPAATVTTTALSTTFVSASSIPPLLLTTMRLYMRIWTLLRGMFKGMLPRLNLRKRIQTLLRSVTYLAELILLRRFLVFLYCFCVPRPPRLVRVYRYEAMTMKVVFVCRPMRLHAFTRWERGQGHMGMFGRGEGMIWYGWGVGEYVREEG